MPNIFIASCDGWQRLLLALVDGDGEVLNPGAALRSGGLVVVGMGSGSVVGGSMPDVLVAGGYWWQCLLLALVDG